MPVVVSLMIPYFFGLGMLLFLLCESVRAEAGVVGDPPGLQHVASCLIFGVELNHFLVLLLSDLKSSLLVASSLSVAAFLLLILKYRSTVCEICSPQRLLLCIALYLAALYVVLGEPVSGWDARSIWFFHGKMIYYNGSINAGGDWVLPSAGFSHTDYPELVPILAAQVAMVAGYWNEYLPKLSLVALLLPALLLMLSLLGRKWWCPVLIAVPLAFNWPWLTNGYMDGYLAVYAGLSAFFLGRWLERGARMDLVTGLLSAGIVLDLKNEGMLCLLILSALAFCFLLLKRVRLAALCTVRVLEDVPLLLFVASGWMLWERKKHLFHLKNDLQLGVRSLETVLHRLSEGSLAVIIKYLYVVCNVNLSLGILLLSLVWNLRKGRRASTGAMFCASVAALYFSGIVTIYLATPYDLVSFHLPTGNRTMLPVHMILLAASISLFPSSAGRAQFQVMD